MAHFNKLVETLEPSTSKIQELSNTELVTIVVARADATEVVTFQMPENGKPQRVERNDSMLVYATGSLFKIFIAAGLRILIDKLSTDPSPDNRYGALRNAWYRPFTDVFNDFSKDIKMAPLPGNPTVQEILVHYKGIQSVNHLILFADGTPLLSKNDFIERISQYVKGKHGLGDNRQAWSGYSNANFILVGLLIEVVSGSLCGFLKEHLFDPLEMHHTYMTATEVDILPIESRIQPHKVSSSGYRRVIRFENTPNLADSVETAALGGYSCPADFAAFFRALLSAVRGNPRHPNLDANIAKGLLRGISHVDSEKMYGYKPGGLFLSLDTRLAGSHSLNRLLSPDSVSSAYVPGLTSDGEVIEACYLSGSLTGWGHTAYFIPKRGLLVAVLTNSSGPLDASDLITRLYLQEILDLRPHRFERRGLNRHFDKLKGWLSSKDYRAFYVDLAAQILKENSEVVKKLEVEDAAADTEIAYDGNIDGEYVNENFPQSLIVKECNRMLRVFMRQGPKKSNLMRLVAMGDAFRICSLVENESIDLCIDCFGDWRNLEFKAERDGKRVTCLTRRTGPDSVDRFVRK